VNASYAYGPADRPAHPNHTTAHHHGLWLARARDRVDKALGVEIYRAADYRRMRLHWNGCGLLLHEYCHLIHQLVLPDGLENQLVRKAHGLASVSGLYDCVRRRDWAGLERDFDMAYATVDCKEFFAEMSVAYWSQGYGSGLDRQDPRQILLCSPPFVEPTVIQRIERISRAKSKQQSFFINCLQPRAPHCNKFYPFTRGQLRFYDRSTYDTMERLWADIEAWDNPEVADDACIPC
jgi:hypothetical protein